MQMFDPYELARLRVTRSPRLAKYADIILYDWPEGDAHWQWVASAPLTEIVVWALTVRDGMAGSWSDKKDTGYPGQRK